MRILIIGMLFCGIALAQDMETLRGERGDYQYRKSHWFDVDKQGDLIVKNVHADVKVTGWNQSRVEIIENADLNVYTREEAKEIVDQFESSFSQSGSRITIRGNSHGHWNKKYLEIKVPSGFSLDIRVEQGAVFTENVDGNVDIRSNNGDVAVKDIGGNVTMRTAGGNLEAFGVEGSCEGRTSGGNITYENLGLDSQAKTSGGNIRVTNAKKSLLLKTSGGEIGVKHAGGSVVAQTNGGSIGVRDCQGDADLRTNGGNLFLKDITGGINGKTNGGDIIGVNLEGMLSVETNGGDIELQDIRAGVRALTYAGDISLEITSTDFSKNHTTDLKTRHGDIHLSVPPKMPFNVSATITKNSRWERYEIYTDFPMTKEATNSSRITRSSGKVNGGGDQMTLETSAGNIYIEADSGKGRNRNRMRSGDEYWDEKEHEHENEDCGC